MDAARECVLAFGVRRTSLSDVARRAGVSRPTVYRRWPDRTALVADVMTREWARVITGARPDEARFATVREHLVAHVIAGVQAMRAHPLFQKITDVDPELTGPYARRRAEIARRTPPLPGCAARSVRVGPAGRAGGTPH